MAKRSKVFEWYIIYNNLARIKGVPIIEPETKMSFAELAEKITWINTIPYPDRNKPPQKEMPHWVRPKEDTKVVKYYKRAVKVYKFSKRIAIGTYFQITLLPYLWAK